ncbi:MAG: zinc ABC transporter substrate-binding protein [Bacilli bacterium]|nr:zinc ABC transporter substrate-binding protein [Bacilli bacterium]
MKKFIKLLILGLFTTTLLTGCFKRDSLEGVKIYTTVYPIEYLTETLYGNNSKVYSIYPNGVNVNEYKLTKKQINNYSKAGIFIYNGLSNEKNIAKEFINANHKIKIIDVSYGLKYENGVEELWMSPNNYLMLATTIKNNLEDYISSKYIIDEIENNYKPLQEEVSKMDAELRAIASSAKDKDQHTIVASNNMFKYLNNYGFNVLSLEDKETISENNLNAIKSSFKSKKYKYIIIANTDEKTDLIKDLENNYGAKTITVNTMKNLTTEDRNNNLTYLTFMKEYIENIRTITLGK